jgi:hypothetical protein
MSYERIDDKLSAWVATRSLLLNKSSKDEEVRSIEVTDHRGRRYQMWIDQPSDDGVVRVNAWDHRKRKVEFSCREDQIVGCLDAAYQKVREWTSAP